MITLYSVLINWCFYRVSRPLDNWYSFLVTLVSMLKLLSLASSPFLLYFLWKWSQRLWGALIFCKDTIKYMNRSIQRLINFILKIVFKLSFIIKAWNWLFEWPLINYKIRIYVMFSWVWFWFLWGIFLALVNFLGSLFNW